MSQNSFACSSLQSLQVLSDGSHLTMVLGCNVGSSAPGGQEEPPMHTYMCDAEAPYVAMAANKLNSTAPYATCRYHTRRASAMLRVLAFRRSAGRTTGRLTSACILCFLWLVVCLCWLVACTAVSASCTAVSASCTAVSASCTAVSASCTAVSASCTAVSASCTAVSASCTAVSASCTAMHDVLPLAGNVTPFLGLACTALEMWDPCGCGIPRDFTTGFEEMEMEVEGEVSCWASQSWERSGAARPIYRSTRSVVVHGVSGVKVPDILLDLQQ
ncbi:unnamed protein product [Closterium sp. Yama58-4]|nr:unnamed protein product [Closterium sp. Yama58-4]